MDVFDVAAVVREMKGIAEGRYIDKVYQNGDEIFIKVKGAGKEIFIKSGKWIFLSSHRQAGEHPPPFAMALRKHIGNGRIASVRQYDFDRIVILEIYKGERYFLIAEIIPGGNIILTDEEMNIINLLKHQRWSHRILKRGEKYEFPPSRYSIEEMTAEEFHLQLGRGKDVVRGLVMMGFPGIWAEEICAMAKVDKSSDPSELSDDEKRRLYDAAREMVERLRKGEYSPVALPDFSAVFPFPPPSLEGRELITFGSVSEAMEEYFVRNFTGEEEVKSKEKKEKILRQMEQQKDAIKRFLEEEENYRRQGDAIFANYERVKNVIEGKERADREKYPKAWLLLDYNHDTIEVEIDLTKSVNENAGEKYEMSKKMREKIEGARKAMEESMRKLQEMEREEADSHEKKEPRKRKFWFENYRWFISSEGNIVVGGKDAKSNERVVKKYLGDDDIYVHADIHGAPSCVVKASDVDGRKKDIGEATLKEACQFAAAYSRAWKQFAVANVYWVNSWQVSKKAESGEYLPRGAFMVRGKKNYEKVVLELGVGMVEIKGERLVMAAPPSAVEKHAERWIRIVPGEGDRRKVAEEIASRLGCHVEEVMRVMPPGGIRIKEEGA